jgi:hypothetical protein
MKEENTAPPFDASLCKTDPELRICQTLRATKGIERISGREVELDVEKKN